MRNIWLPNIVYVVILCVTQQNVCVTNVSSSVNLYGRYPNINHILPNIYTNLNLSLLFIHLTGLRSVFVAGRSYCSNANRTNGWRRISQIGILWYASWQSYVAEYGTVERWQGKFVISFSINLPPPNKEIVFYISQHFHLNFVLFFRKCRIDFDIIPWKLHFNSVMLWCFISFFWFSVWLIEIDWLFDLFAV